MHTCSATKRDGSTVTDVVMDDNFYIAITYGKQELDAIDGLDLHFINKEENN